MQINIRPMEFSDIREVVSGWNKALIHDQVTEERFKGVIINDANYEEESALVAIHDDKIVGFIGAVVREGITGADNRGRPEEDVLGYIKGLCVLDNFRRNGIGSMLLDRATEYIKSKGKKFIRILEYSGNYFFPGIDTRYESAISFFENKGFYREYTIDDVDIDLVDFEIGDYQKDAIERARNVNISVVDYDPSMLDEMRIFAKKLNMISWFPEGWEEWYKSKGNKVVALKGKEIVGWASFGVSGEIGWFGPTGVLVEMRHNGIGSWILLESVLQMKSAGAKRVIASWANTPFYIANDWKICRQYGVYEKQLEK